MTDKHADRANGDSYFTVEELEFLISIMDFLLTRVYSDKNVNAATLTLESLKKEMSYIEATKCKTIGC